MMRQGECVKCESTNLNYGVVEIEDDWLFYPYECNDCHATGREYYDMEYSETVADEHTPAV